MRRFLRILSCRQTSALLSQAQDRKLTLLERAGLYLHLMVCTGCRQFERQLGFLRVTVRRYLEGDGSGPRQ